MLQVRNLRYNKRQRGVGSQVDDEKRTTRHQFTDMHLYSRPANREIIKMQICASIYQLFPNSRPPQEAIYMTARTSIFRGFPNVGYVIYPTI
jgi:hypothetical protein